MWCIVYLVGSTDSLVTFTGATRVLDVKVSSSDTVTSYSGIWELHSLCFIRLHFLFCDACGSTGGLLLFIMIS